MTQDKQESWEKVLYRWFFENYGKRDGSETLAQIYESFYWLATEIVAQQREEIAQEIEGMKKNDLMVEAKDNDFHRYQIPNSKTDEWREWLKIPADDERSWEPPEWAERIDGMPVTNAISYNQALVDVLAKLAIKKEK